MGNALVQTRDRSWRGTVLEGGFIESSTVTLKILVISDLAGKVPDIDPATRASVDMVLIAGDITLGAKHEKSITKVFTRLSKAFPAPLPVFHVPGNHDYPIVAGREPWNPSNFTPLHDRVHVLDVPFHPRRVIIVGFGGAHTGMYNNFAFDEDIIKSSLDELCEQARKHGGFKKERSDTILLLHDVPFGTMLDVATGTGHVGSRAVREIIEIWEPDLCVGGHIHESPGIQQLGRSTCINAGEGKGGRHAIARIADDGTANVELR